MENPIDALLAAQEIQGYEEPEGVLECWSLLCYYKVLGFQPEESDPDMLFHYLLYYYWNNEEEVLNACMSPQDILDLGYEGFFSTIESKELAWEYYCELLCDPDGLIPLEAVEFFGLDTWPHVDVSMEVDGDDLEQDNGDISMVDSGEINMEDDDDVSMEDDSSEDELVNIRVVQWMKDNDIPMMYGAGKNSDFKIVGEREKTYPNFPLRGREITIKPQVNAITDPEEYVESLFNFAVDHLLRDVDPDSYVGFTIESSNCNVGKPIFIPWRFRAHLNVQHILRSIENVLNSNETFLLGEKVTVKVDITDPIRGQGRYGNDKYLPLEKCSKTHYSS